MDRDDPREEELEVLGMQQQHPPPPDAEGDDSEASIDAEEYDGERQPENEPHDSPLPEAECDAMPTRPGLQPKLHGILCREASDVGETTGTFARAEASLLHEGVEYDWPVSVPTEEAPNKDFDGSGVFLVERMTDMITKAGVVSGAIEVEALTTKQPMLKPLPDAPRDHDRDASDLVVVSNGKRFLYANQVISSGDTVPYAYAVSETSVSLLKSSVSMQFKQSEDACECGAVEMKTIAWFDPATGCPTLRVEHPLEGSWQECPKQPKGGWVAAEADLCRVLQVSTWPEHEVRALQTRHVTEYVAPFDVEIAGLALFDKHYKTTILVDVLDAKLGSAIIKCGAVSKPALFCADCNTRLWMVRDMAQSTLVDNQVDQLCTHAMAMAKRPHRGLHLLVQRLKERSRTAGWPDLLRPSKKEVEEHGDEVLARLAKLRAGLKQPHLRSWYDGIALHQHHATKMLLKRVPHCGLGGKADVSPFNPPSLLPFDDGQLIDFGQGDRGGIVRRIEQADLLTKTLQYPLPNLEASMPWDLGTATEAQLRAFGTQLGDVDATLEYAKFMKMYFNYEGGVMYKLSAIAKALVGDTFLSSLYVQLGARKPSGEFIQGAGKGMTTAIDQMALGEYSDSKPLSLLFYNEKVDGASPGFAKLEAVRYVLINEANQQQDKSGCSRVINQNILRRLVPQGPEEKLSARQLFEGFLDFYAQIISLVVNLNDMHAGLFTGRRAQAVYISPVFLPPSEHDKWMGANQDANALSSKWREAVIAVAGPDGAGNANVHRGSSTNPYDADTWKRMAKIHLACATLLARRCVYSGEWPAVPTVNETLTNQMLEEEANRESADKEGVDPAVLQRLADAWHDFAVPCPTGLKTASSSPPHACGCKHGEHERWCVVGAEAFATWLGARDKTLAKAVRATKGSKHVISLLRSAVHGLEGAHCDRVRRAAVGTPYGADAHRVSSAILGWRAKSEGALSRKEAGKKPVARVERPTKRKSKTLGAETKTKKQKTITKTIQGDEIEIDAEKAPTSKKVINMHASKSEESDSGDEDDDSDSDEDNDEEDDFSVQSETSEEEEEEEEWEEDSEQDDSEEESEDDDSDSAANDDSKDDGRE